MARNLFDNAEGAAGPALSVRQSPGGFFYFWNLLVPLTVVLNIHHFGLRAHEAGLLLALCIGPHVFEYLVQNTFLVWTVLIFLFIWIERILRRWPWYRIYSCCFARTLFFSLALVAVPTLAIRWLWYPMYRQMPKAFKYVDPTMSKEDSKALSDGILLVLSVLVLLHSLYLYRKETTCQ